MKLKSTPKPVRFRIQSGGVEHTSLDSLLKHFDFKVILDNKENFIKWLERIDREKAGKLKEILSSGDEKFIDTYNKVLNLFWGEKDIINHWISWYENEKENFKHIDSNIQDFPEKLRKIKSFISGNYNEAFDEVDKDVFDKWNKIFKERQENFAIGKDLTLGEASVIQFLFAYHMIRSDKKQYFNKKSELLSRNWIFKVLGVEEIKEGYDEIGILNKLGFNKLIECDPWYNEKVVLYDQNQQLDILPKIKNSYFPAYYLLEEKVKVKSDTLESGRNPGIFLGRWFNNIWDYHNHKEGLQGDEPKVKVEISSISKSDPKDDCINRDAIYSWISWEFAVQEQYSWFPEFNKIQVDYYKWNDKEKNLKDFIVFFLNALKYSSPEREETLYQYNKFNYLIPQINLFESFVRHRWWFDEKSAQNILIENHAFTRRLANLLEEIFYTSSRDTFISNFIKLCAFNILEFH